MSTIDDWRKNDGAYMLRICKFLLIEFCLKYASRAFLDVFKSWSDSSMT